MVVLNFRKQIKGSTLVETLVAMIVILISLVFCGIILFNILSSGNNIEIFRAYTMLNEMAIKTKSERKYFDEEIVEGSIAIQKSLRPFNGIKDLYIQSFAASNAKGKVIAEYKELIFIPE